MDDVDAMLARLAGTQHGLLSRAQARAAGLSRTQIAHRLCTGRWVAYRRGVYVFPAAAATPAQAALAACLSAGRPAFAARRTAAALHGLQVIHPGRRIELVSRHQIRLAGARATRSAHLPDEDLTRVAAVPATTVERTLFDLSAVIPGRVLESAMDEALRLGLTTVAGLHACLSRLEGACLAGTDRYRAALAWRRMDEAAPDSVLERKARRILRAAGLPEPTCQYAVPFPDRTFHLDLAWPEARVALEVDGWDGHRLRGRFDRDRARQNRLQAAGWLVLHYTSRMDPHLLVTTVRAALTARGACRSA